MSYPKVEDVIEALRRFTQGSSVSIRGGIVYTKQIFGGECCWDVFSPELPDWSKPDAAVLKCTLCEQPLRHDDDGPAICRFCNQGIANEAATLVVSSEGHGMRKLCEDNCYAYYESDHGLKVVPHSGDWGGYYRLGPNPMLLLSSHSWGRAPGQIFIPIRSHEALTPLTPPPHSQELEDEGRDFEAHAV